MRPLSGNCEIQMERDNGTRECTKFRPSERERMLWPLVNRKVESASKATGPIMIEACLHCLGSALRKSPRIHPPWACGDDEHLKNRKREFRELTQV